MDCPSRERILGLDKARDSNVKTSGGGGGGKSGNIKIITKVYNLKCFSSFSDALFYSKHATHFKFPL